MEIIIDKENRIRTTDEYFAPMKQRKQGRKGLVWTEYKWFTSLPACMEYIARNHLCNAKTALSTGEFLAAYKAERVRIHEIVNVLVDKLNQEVNAGVDQ